MSINVVNKFLSLSLSLVCTVGGFSGVHRCDFWVWQIFSFRWVMKYFYGHSLPTDDLSLVVRKPVFGVSDQV